MSAMNKKRTESTETLKKVLRFIGRYRILLVVSIVLAAASVLLQLYVPILFGNAIDQIIAEQKVNFLRCGAGFARYSWLYYFQAQPPGS